VAKTRAKTVKINTVLFFILTSSEKPKKRLCITIQTLIGAMTFLCERGKGANLGFNCLAYFQHNTPRDAKSTQMRFTMGIASK
jgi:hypothetical protein